MQPLPSAWITPDWPAPPGVRAVCTTRACPPGAAASAPPWRGFNLGAHVGDAPAAVAAHRAALGRALGVRPVFLEQVHGVQVQVLRAGVPDGRVADAACCAARGLACTVMVADCLPVLLARADGRAVAAAHAGWRGLAAGVLEAAVQALRDVDKARPEPSLKSAQKISKPPETPVNTAIAAMENVANRGFETGEKGCVQDPAAPALLAWLGPCIGPAAFEVGAPVRAAFMDAAGRGDAAAQARVAACFAPAAGGKYRADLPALARLRLAALGVAAWGNDGSAAWCTVSQPRRFYSYRAQGVTGRMAACIWLE